MKTSSEQVSGPRRPLPARYADGLAAVTPLDRGTEWLDPIVQRLLANSRRRDLFHGRWLGHALHPLLSDFPLGAWTCTSLLDLFGGKRSRPAAEGLLAFGLAAAVPTVLTGAAEWGVTRGGDKRIGTAHAGINATAAVLYAASLAARRCGRHGLGVAFGLAGGGTAVLGGYLGGHLSIARKVGTGEGPA